MLGIASIVIRFPKPETQSYICADATWHTLLTIEAYNNTPASIHKFLPIVSLGHEDDKGISWGGTVPDEFGNYYYTSFSPLGYVAPWLFFNIFNLPNNEASLYVFNSLLYLSCFVMLTAFMLKLFSQRVPKTVVVIISALYLFQPEILHSQGIVYWHHSLFQLVFLAQLLLFVNMEGKWKTVAFFLLCVVAPYLECTGYVSNVGFAIAFLFKGGITIGKENIVFKTDRVAKIIGVLFCTLTSGFFFVFHYLTTVPSAIFWNAISSRYNARKTALFSQLGKGYLDSFGMLIALVVIVFFIMLLKNCTRKSFVDSLRDNGFVLFILAFALIENIIMTQHAVLYTFDRMKVVFPLLFLLVVCVSAICHNVKRKRLAFGTFTTLIVLVSGIAFVRYYQESSFKWEVPYLKDNRTLVNALASEYTHENSIFTQNFATRGYTNLLFGRGVYEGMTYNSSSQLAQEQGKRYAVFFEPRWEAWNMYEYSNFTIIDLEKKSVANLTDSNWTNGVANSHGNILLFANSPQYSELLLQSTPTEISTANGASTAAVVSVEEKGNYIWVYIEKSADRTQFAYPAELEIH